jgi:hypothetical protein
MKKLFFLIAGLLLIIGLQAQTSGTTYTLAPNETSKIAFNYTHTGDWDATSLKDSIGGTATKYWIFAVNKSQLYYYSFVTEFDTVLTQSRATGNHVTVNLYGSVNGTYWVKMDSTLFHPTTSYLPAAQEASAALAAVGVAGLKDVSTGVLWRYLKVEAVGGDANTCSIISKLHLKVGLKN